MADAWPTIDCYLQERGIQVGAPTPGQTTSGGHVQGSLHYQGRARDYGTATSDAGAVFAAILPLANDPNGPIEELFYRDQAIKNGQHIGAVAGHYTHTHVGLKAGAALPCKGDPGKGGGAGASSKGGGDPFGTALEGCLKALGGSVLVLASAAGVVVWWRGWW